MASGEAEPLQYTTTVLRVSIHCEGCKKKVKKVLHNIEGVYKVTVDAAQHKVTVTGSVGADELVRRLHKAGKLAALWTAPAAIVEAAAKKPEVVVAPEPVPAVESDKVEEGAGEADAEKPKEAAKDKGADKKQQQLEAEGKGKKPEKDKGSDKKPEKAEAAKPKDDEPKKDAEVTALKEKQGSPAPPAKESAATEEAGAEEQEPSSGKKGKKGKKNKQQKDGGGECEAALAAEKTPHSSTPAPVVPAPAPPPPGPERPLGGVFPYYAAQQPVTSYNVAHPSSSVSYYAPAPVGPVQPMPPPPQMAPYGYYSPTMMPELMYGPPGIVRSSSPPQESYNNMFNEENANSCSVM